MPPSCRSRTLGSARSSGIAAHPYAHPSSLSSNPSYSPFPDEISPSGDTLKAPIPPTKTRKQLDGRFKKEVCEYAARHPDTLQEKLATQFEVDRSTISKILKSKEKWLSIGEDAKDVVKHRFAKFPAIDFLLIPWLVECRYAGAVLSDKEIAIKAKEIARSLGIGEEEFKASGGWVEHFKQRQGIHDGVWEGRKFADGTSCFDDTLDPPDLEDELELFAAKSQLYCDVMDALKERERPCHLMAEHTIEQQSEAPEDTVSFSKLTFSDAVDTAIKATLDKMNSLDPTIDQPLSFPDAVDTALKVVVHRFPSISSAELEGLFVPFSTLVPSSPSPCETTTSNQNSPASPDQIVSQLLTASDLNILNDLGATSMPTNYIANVTQEPERSVNHEQISACKAIQGITMAEEFIMTQPMGIYAAQELNALRVLRMKFEHFLHSF
ncbi:hypothetical protein SCHPADRAFT_897490 [Schizopora paradoxa]|uniref:HTH CENPB-type domain-containing protein n=1 Tax=Schizopora paradoxa TaxID=27342 RepID=A0A0H2R310_9AGAM|nr:hypothetical protein SCHPADRAFT_897490 [Schizopora paradoxa]